jgi:hypothetical protein
MVHVSAQSNEFNTDFEKWTKFETSDSANSWYVIEINVDNESSDKNCAAKFG